MAKQQIKAGHTNVYILNDDERAAIEEAERSRMVSDEDVEKFWKRYGIEPAGSKSGGSS